MLSIWDFQKLSASQVALTNQTSLARCKHQWSLIWEGPVGIKPLLFFGITCFLWCYSELIKFLKVFNRVVAYEFSCWCSATIYANRHYLNIYHRTHPGRLAVNAPEKPNIIGDVFIHPHAVVHPTATVSAECLWLKLNFWWFLADRTFVTVELLSWLSSIHLSVYPSVPWQTSRT